MNKILTIVGARPQFIKAAAVGRAIRDKYSDTLEEVILHTGQHYDVCMSEVFFNELGISEPAYNLNVGSTLQGAQTAEMLKGIENVILLEKPNAVIVYGDTNSTLAGALAASKLQIPVAHIEAGLRSFNKQMPEEINRIVTDHVSTFLFSPTIAGLENLKREGFSENNSPAYTKDNPMIMHCGDVMYDNCLYFAGIVEKSIGELNKFNLKDKDFVLVTIHRNTNTDNPKQLKEIFESLVSLAIDDKTTFVLPIHPRTRKALKIAGIKEPKEILMIDPVSYFEMLWLEKNAAMIITDSGGVQKEAYFHKKKCLVLRDETEWVELIEQGSLIIAGHNKENIMQQYYILKQKQINDFPPLYGDGHAAEFICSKLLLYL
jgi:UDP-GlcNAc3NAcA epimerase